MPAWENAIQARVCGVEYLLAEKLSDSPRDLSEEQQFTSGLLELSGGWDGARYGLMLCSRSGFFLPSDS